MGSLKMKSMLSNLKVLRSMIENLMFVNLKKALYGLTQSPRAWYSRIDGYLSSLGSKNSDVDSKLYYKIVEGESLIPLLYVDDLFLTGVEVLIVQRKRELVSEFEMKDLGLMHYYLGLEIW